MALRYVLVVLVAAVSLASQPPPPRDLRRIRGDPDLPCPNAMAILPCTCHTNNLYFMTIDCSQVNTNEDLERVFKNPFPFEHFQQLIIDHDPTDPNNRLTKIRSDTFQTLTFERVLIKGTELESIDENVFSYSHDILTQLNLQNNKLNDFPFESLGLYTKLETLLLDGNELRTLEKFSSLSLRTLSIGNNRNLGFTYDVLEEIPNLVNLNMERIGLKAIPQHMFANLTQVYTINFNENQLTELEEFTLDPLTTSVGRLMLSSNRISSALPGALRGLLKDAIVDLSNNEITEMWPYLWQPFFDQLINGMVDLTGNDLTCGCDMSWMFVDVATNATVSNYLPILTDSTACYDGTQVVFLDVNVFMRHCQP